jgi:carbon-monoxide dehydrogenase large subunit
MAQFGIGQPVPRTEDPRLLTGRGRYADDVTLPNQAYGVVVRSPHAHARIRKVDASKARAAPGVLLVLTGEDVVRDGLGGLHAEAMPEDMGGPKSHRPLHPVLVADKVRHVGDRVAFVVAETLAEARDAAELVSVDYEPLPSVTALEDALKPGAPKVWDDAQSNLCFPLMFGDQKAVDEAFAKAKSVHKVALRNNRVSANPMEPRAVVAAYDPAARRTTVHASTQFPHQLRQILAHHTLHVPETDIRVIAGDVGGGFGMKATGYPEDVLVAWASGKLARPVKWTADRSESLLSDTHGRDQLQEAELALDADGRFLALRAKIASNMGAYLSNAAMVPTMFCCQMLSNVYTIPAIHVVAQAAFTHTAPLGVYRGAGRPESIFLVERLIDVAARETGIDAAELRRRNVIPKSAMPYQTALMFNYDSGDFGGLLDKALAMADWTGLAARRAESERRGKRRGAGIGMFIEIAGVFNERAEIRVDSGGSVAVLPGTFSHGQGHETVFAQMVSDWLGVPFERIRVLQGDTDETTFGRGTFAARSMALGGSALKQAADRVIDKGKKFAAHLLEASEADIEFAGGTFKVAGTDRAIPLAGVARASYAPMGMPPELGIGLDASGSFPGVPNFPNGCHVCEVEVDPATGEVSIERFVSVDDVGLPINPLLLDGQIHGGIAQGVGQALVEHVIYDKGSGQLVTGSFVDYAMPRADLLPSIEVDMHNVPTPSNPLGVKGAGEAGCVGSPPAVINAILDALAPLGVTHLEMPATPERVWRAIRGAEK